MRLSCPNCGAQYEVPDDVIPQAGRDVQCSNCGHTWFQPPPETDVSLTEDLGGSVPDEGWEPEDIPQDEGPSPDIEPEDPARSASEEEVQPPSVDISDAEDESDEETSEYDEFEEEFFEDTPSEPEEAGDDIPEEDADFLEEEDVDTSLDPVEDHDERDETDLADDIEDDDPLSDDLAQAIDKAVAYAGHSSDEFEEQEEETDLNFEPEIEDSELEEDLAEAEDADDDPLEGDETLEEVAEDQQSRRKPLDANVAEILQEEAEHEARQRAAEASVGLESQPDLGLSAPAPVPQDENSRRVAEARSRMRRMRGLPEDDAPVQEPPEFSPAMAEDTHNSRRDLLPDIEEINSTLRSAEDRELADPEAPMIYGKRQRRRGFRLGFSLVLLVAAAGILAYGNDHEIAEAVPEAAPYLTQYTEGVNDARVWLDTRVTEMMLALQSAAGQETTTPEQ